MLKSFVVVRVLNLTSANVRKQLFGDGLMGKMAAGLINNAAGALKEDGIVVLGINIGDDKENIARFLAQTPVSFPVLPDADQETVRAMPVIGLPTTLVVNAAGIITHRVTGEREWDAPSVLEAIRRAAQ